MNNLAALGYTHDQVKKMLSGSREIDFRFELLDKNDMPIGNVTATGAIDYSDSAEIKRVANFSIAEKNDIDFLNDRIKPYMRVNLGAWVEYPLGVFLMDSPTRNAYGSQVNRNVECFDKTLILRDDRFTTRYRVAAGTVYTAAINNIIMSAGLTNIRIDSSALTLQTDIEFDVGTSKLEAVNQLARAINYNDVYVDSKGCVKVSTYVEPIARTIEDYYVTGSDSIVLPGAEENLDLFNAPNKIIRYLETAELGCLIAEATNDDPASKLSTVSRGRTIVDAAGVYDIANQDTLTAYTNRIAAEKKIYQEVTFASALMPHHEALNCLYLDNSELNIRGKYIETGWNMTLAVGGEMRHSCKRSVSI